MIGGLDISVAVIAVGLFLALVLERLFELYVKPPIPERFKWVVPYLAGLAGLGLAFVFSIDLMTPVLEAAGITPAADWLGRVLTGLAIGGGSNLVHELWPTAKRE